MTLQHFFASIYHVSNTAAYNGRANCDVKFGLNLLRHITQRPSLILVRDVDFVTRIFTVRLRNLPEKPQQQELINFIKSVIHC